MYITADDLYDDESVSESEFPSAFVTSRIETAQSVIESITKKWFESRPKVYLVDGTGDDEIRLPAAIISISKVEIQRSSDGFDDFAMSNFAVYNSSPDDWYNPIIAISRFGYLDIEAEISKFSKGRKNVRVTGNFGWVNADGETPADIIMATKLLTVEYLGAAGDDSLQANLARYGLKREETNKHEHEWFESATSGKLTGFAPVDRLLMPYTYDASVGVV